MRPLKLLTAPAVPGGWHRIGAPGGYETWHFYAEDPARKLRVAVGFHEGMQSNPLYARQFRAYRSAPTRCAPPRPAEFPGIRVTFCEGEVVVADAASLLPAGTLRADEAGSVSLGSNTISMTPGEILVEAAQSAAFDRVSLRFISRLAPPAVEGLFPPGYEENDEHGWVLDRPLCEVSGRIHCRGRTFDFKGTGIHSHFYGTARLPRLQTHLLRGWILAQGAAEVFQVYGDRAMRAIAGEGGFEVHDMERCDVDWKISWFGKRLYPRSIDLSSRLTLRNPRLLTNTERHLGLVYDAYRDGEHAIAWVELEQG